MQRTGLVAVVSEAGVEPRRAFRQRAWFRRRLDSSRASESCRWTEMPLTEMPLGQMQVDGGDLEIAMAEQDLNRAQVRAGFEKVCGEAMSQSVRMDVPVLKAGAFGGDLAGSP